MSTNAKKSKNDRENDRDEILKQNKKKFIEILSHSCIDSKIVNSNFSILINE